QELPGQELFQYLDDRERRRQVNSADVNDYLRTAAGDDFTAKDFRTWAGTVLAARALKMLRRPKTKVEAKRQVIQAIEAVASCLGNTASVCRKCYIHPAILDAHLSGSLANRRRQASAAMPHGLD